MNLLIKIYEASYGILSITSCRGSFLSQWLVPSFVATSMNIINLWIIYFLAFLSVHIWLINVSPTEFNTLMTFVHTRRYSFIQVTYCFTTCKCIVKRLLLEWLLYQSISYIVRQISNYHLNKYKSWRLLVDLCLLHGNLALKMNFQKLCLRIFKFSYPNVSHLLITKIWQPCRNLYKCKHQFSES